MSNESRQQRRTAPALLLLAAALLAAVACYAIPVAASQGPNPWEDGIVRFYDAAGLGGTVTTAAERWNESGARVRLIEVFTEDDADVVVTVNDAKLRGACGGDCLGYTSSIGRPSSDDQVEVLLAGELTGDPRPLSVWVAAHEFGHVLGLHHRDGNACSLMSAHAFDTSCAPSLAASPPTPDQLACVPAPKDVEDAAALYGGRLVWDDTRCR